MIAHGRLGKLVTQREPCAGGILRQFDRDARGADRNRIAAGKAECEYDSPRRIDLQHLAALLDRVGMPDVDLAARPRIDRRAGSPPGGPASGVREKAKDGFLVSA